MLRDPQLAMDVTQWTFLRAVEVDLDVSVRPKALRWLYSTAHNRCLTLLRNRRTRARILEAHGDEVLPLHEPSPESVAVSRGLLLQASEQLDELSLSVAAATYLQGMSVQRCAEMLEKSTRTIIRARKRFEAVMRDLLDGEEAP